MFPATQSVRRAWALSPFPPLLLCCCKRSITEIRTGRAPCPAISPVSPGQDSCSWCSSRPTAHGRGHGRDHDHGLSHRQQRAPSRDRDKHARVGLRGLEEEGVVVVAVVGLRRGGRTSRRGYKCRCLGQRAGSVGAEGAGLWRPVGAGEDSLRRWYRAVLRGAADALLVPAPFATQGVGPRLEGRRMAGGCGRRGLLVDPHVMAGEDLDREKVGCDRRSSNSTGRDGRIQSILRQGPFQQCRQLERAGVRRVVHDACDGQARETLQSEGGLLDVRVRGRS